MTDTFDIQMSDGVVKIPLEIDNKPDIVNAIYQVLPTNNHKVIDLLNELSKLTEP